MLAMEAQPLSSMLLIGLSPALGMVCCIFFQRNSLRMNRPEYHLQTFTSYACLNMFRKIAMTFNLFDLQISSLYHVG